MPDVDRPSRGKELSPSEPEPTLTERFKPLIDKIGQDAIQPLLDKLLSMDNEISSLKFALSAKDGSLVADYDLNLARMSKRIGLIEKGKSGEKPSEMQEKDAKILRALIASNGGKMSTKEARQAMKNMDKGVFSRLVDKMPDIETKHSRLDKRQILLVLKSQKIVDINNQQSNQDLDRT